MKTAAEHVPARYICTESSRTPSPRFRRSWSHLHQLRWKASLIMAEHPGVRLYIEKGRSWTNGRFNYGEYSVSYSAGLGGGGMSPMPFERVWDVLRGIDLGLSMKSGGSQEDGS